MAVEHELHALSWRTDEPVPTPRAALYMTAIQVEAGFACPITRRRGRRVRVDGPQVVLLGADE